MDFAPLRSMGLNGRFSWQNLRKLLIITAFERLNIYQTNTINRCVGEVRMMCLR